MMVLNHWACRSTCQHRWEFRCRGRAPGRGGIGVVFTNLVIALNTLGRRNEALALCRDFESRVPAADEPEFLGDAVCLAWSLLSYEGNVPADSPLEFVCRHLGVPRAETDAPGTGSTSP